MLMVGGGHGFRMQEDTVCWKSSRVRIRVSMKRSASKVIPVNEPSLGVAELENVTECLRTGWISSAGKFIDEFETKWAAYCGRRYGVAVSNGTTALQLAVACLDLKPGDEVIMPSFTIISCALAVVYNQGYSCPGRQ